METYGVSLVSKDSNAVDLFYKYRGDCLPDEGEVIDVVRFLRARAIRARVTRVDAGLNPPISASQID
jgi:hypothetical protein